MPPRLILAVRHGESEWNVLHRQYSNEEDRYAHPVMYTPDCDMTEKGIQQSQQAGRKVQEVLAKDSKARTDERMLWIVSPLRRALQTARHMKDSIDCPEFQPASLVVDKNCAEVMLDACDIGSIPTALVQEFPEFDFSALLRDDQEPYWWPFHKSQEETWENMRHLREGGREPEAMVRKRIDEFKATLQALCDCEVVVVVCHSETIWWLTTERTILDEKEEKSDNEPQCEDGVWTDNGEVLDITKYILGAEPSAHDS